MSRIITAIEFILMASMFLIGHHYALLFVLDLLFLVWICRNFLNGKVRVRIVTLIWFTGSMLILINIIKPDIAGLAMSGLFLKMWSIYVFRSKLKVFRDAFLKLSIPVMWLSTHYGQGMGDIPLVLLVVLGAGALYVVVANINELEIKDLVATSAILYSSLFFVMSVQYKDFAVITLLSFVAVSGALYMCDIKSAEIPALLLIMPLPPFPFFFFERMLAGASPARSVVWTSVIVMSLIACASLLNINRKIRFKKVLWE